jgi:alpha-L-rhamnosidase
VSDTLDFAAGGGADAGFRYIQLTGYPGTPDFKTLTAHFIHTDYEMTGSVSFSDPDLTAVQHITRTAAMSNFQSIPTDCPQ